jgi:hypothetical protein
MVRRNPDLDALRAEIRRKQRNAQAKINRNKHKGINLGSTNYNPRNADLAKFMRYTTKQLIAYGKKLDEFTSRNTQFVAGANGTPLERSAFERYKELERKHNAIGESRMGERGGFKAPGSGMTIREREATMRPDSKRAQGDVVNRPYSKIERKAINIASADALEKLTRDMERKLNRSYLPKKMKESRQQLREMLTMIGNDELNKHAQGLTDFQFDVLWNDTKFATDIGLIYGVMQMKAAGGKDRWYSSVVEDYSNDIMEALRWAKTLPRTQADANKQGR